MVTSVGGLRYAERRDFEKSVCREGVGGMQRACRVLGMWLTMDGLEAPDVSLPVQLATQRAALAALNVAVRVA